MMSAPCTISLSWIAVCARRRLFGYCVVKAIWRLRSEWQRRRGGRSTVCGRRAAAIWRDPGPVSALDLAAGPGGTDGAPAPPFQFSKNTPPARNPCVSVRDARGTVWRVKWGAEVHTETFGTRLAWAAGYFAETDPLPRRGAHRRRHGPAAREGLHRRDTAGSRTRDSSSTRTRRRQTLRRAQLGLERQPVRRHARAERPEDPDDAAVELGQQGRARCRARIEHRDLRIPRREARARGALPDHRLGRRARRLGQQRHAARTMGCRRRLRHRTSSSSPA